MVITFIFYDPKDKRLRLQFDGGEVYDYYLVPPEIGKQAEIAISGHSEAFFKSSIRGIYPFRRLA